MTITEASAVIDIIEAIWPVTAKDKWGWNTETREGFCERLRPLGITPEQVRAAFRERALRDDKPVGPAAAFEILAELDRAGKRATATADTGLLATLRRVWGQRDPVWANASDEAVLWGYAWNRCRVPGKPEIQPDPIEQSRAFEFEARCLGWEPERIRAALLALGRADGVEAIELDWEEHQRSHGARKMAKAAVMAARAAGATGGA